VAAEVKVRSAGATALVAAAALAVGVFASDFIMGLFNRDDTVRVALRSVREMNRLEVLEAHFEPTVKTTTVQTVAGVPVPGTEKTAITIAAGDVAYFVELGGLKDRDVTWDEGSHTLTITLPQPILGKPNIDIRTVEHYVASQNIPWPSLSPLARGENEARLYRDLDRKARDRDLMERARQSARRSISTLLQSMMNARGDDAISVRVAFA